MRNALPDGRLKDRFPKTNFSALSVGEFPVELGMYFMLNGALAYTCSFDGLDLWNKCIKGIRQGKEFISPDVQERIVIRREYPEAAGIVTDRELEVIRLICNGFKDMEIVDILHISRSTVDNHKTEIFRKLNVRSSNELIRGALSSKLVREEEIYFYPRGFTLNPLPEKKRKRNGGKYDY